MSKVKNIKSFKSIISYLLIIIGALIASFSVACILLPNDAIDYGTAGARLSYEGLPCPNLGTGGANYHGVHECCSVEKRTRQLKSFLT